MFIVTVLAEVGTMWTAYHKISIRCQICWHTMRRVILASRGVQDFFFSQNNNIYNKGQSRPFFDGHCSTNPLLDSHNSGNLKFRDNVISKTDKQFKDARLFYEKSVSFGCLGSNEFQLVSRKFNISNLSPASLDKFSVKLSVDRNSLLFPLCGLDKKIIAIQFLTSKSDQNNKIFEESSFPRVSETAVFGLSQVHNSSPEIVLTSNPLDAVAVNQAAGLATIAFPHDAAVFPLEILLLLDEFQKVTLWFSDDNPDWRSLVGEKLGFKSHFIRHDKDIPSPLLCLQNGLCAKGILRRALCLRHKHVVTVGSLEQELRKRISEKQEGTKWKRFTQLNELLKGHRQGELTIFSGRTGTGKTTFMSEYSLDLCIQGVRTLWASFEIGSLDLMKVMLMQFSLCPSEELDKNIDFWMAEFKNLNLHFLTLHGQHSVKSVIDAMTHAVIVNGVQHVVIDNLQFMINADDLNLSVDQYRLQDRIFTEFRRFATAYNCHVTLVIHPRKEPEAAALNNNSISGTAKATQEANNIIILQKTNERQYIQVTKNRFDGTIGHFFLEFDKSTRSYSLNSKRKDLSTVVISPS